VFLLEEDQGTLPLLRVTFPPASIFLGKLSFNLITLGLAALVLTPILIAFLEAPVERPLVLILGIGSFAACLAGAVSFSSALVVGASNRWIIVVVLAIPLLVPTVFLAVDAIRSGLGSGPETTGWRAVIGLTGYGLALAAVAPILVEAVWGRD
jgi:ABC-type transport system involved in cytochrome c biogenesis permease component